MQDPLQYDVHPDENTPVEPTKDCSSPITVRATVDVNWRHDGNHELAGLHWTVGVTGDPCESPAGTAPHTEIKSDVDDDAVSTWVERQGDSEHSREIGTVRYDAESGEYTWSIDDEFRADARLVTDGGTSTQCSKCGDTSTDDNNVEITYDSDSGSMRCRGCQIGDRLGSSGDVQLPPGSHL